MMLASNKMFATHGFTSIVYIGAYPYNIPLLIKLFYKGHHHGAEHLGVRLHYDFIFGEERSSHRGMFRSLTTSKDNDAIEKKQNKDFLIELKL